MVRLNSPWAVVEGGGFRNGPGQTVKGLDRTWWTELVKRYPTILPLLPMLSQVLGSDAVEPQYSPRAGSR